MCHMNPATQALGLLVFVVGALFITWHIWCFDRGRCLLYTRRDIFRWTILMMLVGAMVCFITWSSIMVWIKYVEYYVELPDGEGGHMIVPVPFQLWSVSRQSLVRSSYHVAAVGWGLLVSVHSEETLYWAYLIGSIRSRNSKSWFKSIQFKLYVLCVLAALGLEVAVSNIETVDLNEMEHNIFFAGAILATILFFGSLWLLFVFPGFIKESRRQGANPEVLGRLQYFKELNIARTVFRFFYSFSLLTLSVDAFTHEKRINVGSPFWMDTLFVMAYFSAVTSTAISIMILLPRSMSSEAGTSKNIPVYINNPHIHSNRRQLHAGGGGSGSGHTTDVESLHTPSLKRAESHSHHVDRTSQISMIGPWDALGDRLNIGKEHLEDLHLHSFAADMAGHGDEEARDGGDGAEMFHLPFAARPGDRRLEEGEVVHQVPMQLDNFISPLAVNTPPRPRDINIVVTTNTVVEKE